MYITFWAKECPGPNRWQLPHRGRSELRETGTKVVAEKENSNPHIEWVYTVGLNYLVHLCAYIACETRVHSWTSVCLSIVTAI